MIEAPALPAIFVRAEQLAQPYPRVEVRRVFVLIRAVAKPGLLGGGVPNLV